MLAVRIAVDRQRPDPRDITIQSYLDKSQWKSALKLVEQQSKKGTNRRLSVNKSLIQMATGTDEISFLGLVTISQLIHSKDNPIVDIGILEAIDYSMPVKLIEQGKELLAYMWERATNLSPRNVQILESGLSSACRNSDFVSARKLAMKAYKIFDNKYANRWRAIAYCYLDGQLNPDLGIVKISKGMGLLLLKQSLEATPPSSLTGLSKSQTRIPIFKDPSSPALQNASDTQLLLLVYKQSDMDEQALSVLESEKAGLRSNIGYGRWKLVLSRLTLLKELRRTEESWKFCYQLIREAGSMALDEHENPPYGFGGSGDDLIVWQTAAENVYELRDTSVLSKFQKLLDDPGFKKRHRLLATIHLSLMIENEPSVFTDFTTSSDTALQTYLDHYFTTGVAYEDLREVAEKLTLEKRANLLEMVLKMKAERAQTEDSNEEEFRSWMHLQLNELKLRYTLEIATFDRFVAHGRLERFANLCISLYISSLDIEKKLAITERRTGDEAAILAASTFIHLWYNGKKSARLQATLILEKLLEHSKHHYGAHVMLVRLYSLLACFDQTMNNYRQLNLKNLQFFTETWVLLNRVATIFPYNHQKLNQDVLTLLKSCTAYAEQKETHLNRLIEGNQSIQNWLGLCKLYEFGKSCNASVSRVSVLAELSRMFYRHQTGDCFGEDTILNPVVGIQRRGKNGVHEDIRCFEGCPNYEALGKPPLIRYLDNGGWISQDWIDTEDLMFTWRRWTKLRTWYTRSLEDHKITGVGLWEFAKSLYKSYNQPDNGPKVVSGMTDAERAVGVLLTLMSVLQEMTNSNKLNVEELVGLTTMTKDKWDVSKLIEYEKCWKSCTIFLFQLFDSLEKKITKPWIDQPLEFFHRDEWEILHYYYKTSELWMIIPSFLLDRVKIAKEFRRLVSVKELSPEDFKVFNPELQEDHLRKTIVRLVNIIEQFNEAARKTHAHYDDPQVLEKQVSQIRGGDLNDADLRGNIGILFDKEWTMTKVRKIARSWQSSLQGIIHEDPQHWRQYKWPSALEKYCDFDALFDSLKKNQGE